MRWALVLSLCVSLGAGSARGEPLEWDPRWPRYRPGEAVATLIFGVGALVAEVAPPRINDNIWRGGVFFDDPVRNALRAQSQAGNARAVSNSDRLYRLGVLAPLVLDVGVLALGVHGSPDVAWQMFLIELESFALTGSLVLASQVITRRERPYVQDCGPQGDTQLTTCGTERDYTSFISGHTAMAMTGAMLMCTHHQRLRLLGGGAADTAVCATMVGAAVGTGLLRIVADRHYATDVIAGLAVGVFSGYVLPSWLHYGFGATPPADPEPRLTWTITPRLERGSIGLGVSGLLP